MFNSCKGGVHAERALKPPIHQAATGNDHSPERIDEPIAVRVFIQ
jgi:hypothetical protein